MNIFRPHCAARGFLKDKPGARVVIIGSGINGLCLGGLLSQAGYRVDILEASPTAIGGHARIIQSGGLRFSAGPQYLWSFGPQDHPYQVLRHLLRGSPVTFRKMAADGFEEIMIGGAPAVSIPMGFERFQSQMIRLFPNEEKGIRTLFRYLYHLFESGKVIDRQGAYGAGMFAMKMAVLQSSLPLATKYYTYRFAGWSLGRMLDYCRLGEPARRLLYGHAGIFCEDEQDVSVVLYAVATGYYHSGAYVPEQGFHALMAALINVIQANGGRIHTGARATRIAVTDQQVRQVICRDGREFAGALFISTLSPRLTARLTDGMQEVEFSYQPSNSLHSAFVVVRDMPEIREKLYDRNIWWQAGDGKINFAPDRRGDAIKFMYVGSNIHELTSAQQAQGLSGLILFSPATFSEAQQEAAKGPTSYDAYKSSVKNQMLDVLEHHIFPGISRKIEDFNLLTPYDLAVDIHAEAGSVYGRRLTYQNLKQPFPQFDHITNLAVLCATTTLPGIAVGFNNAALLFRKLTGKAVIA